MKHYIYCASHCVNAINRPHPNRLLHDALITIEFASYSHHRIVHREGPVVKFKDKFPNHVNPNLEAFSAVFNKAQGQTVSISIRKPRTVPGVRTGGHSGVEFADPELLKRPASSIELDSGYAF